MLRKQRVQALTVCGRPLITMCRCCRFRLNLRLVCRFECEIRLPYCGFLPHISQRAAICPHPFTTYCSQCSTLMLFAHAPRRVVLLCLLCLIAMLTGMLAHAMPSTRVAPG